jgi:hypothetical protein
MKLLRNTAKKVSALILGVAAIYSTNAEMPKDEFVRNSKPQPKFISYSEYNKKTNKSQEINFVTFDSVANTLSYGANELTPLFYDINSDVLMTIKRGSHELADIGFSESTSKNNLLYTATSDYITWSKPTIVYSSKEDGLGDARYPTIFAFKGEDNKTKVVFNFNLLKARATDPTKTDWVGYGVGFKDGDASYKSNVDKFTLNNTLYRYGRLSVDTQTNDSSWFSEFGLLYGYQKEGAIFHVFTAPASPSPRGSTTDNNNISVTTLVDLDPANGFNIPSQLASSKFPTITNTTSATRELFKMVQGPDSKLYLGVFGRVLAAAPDTTMPLCAVSVSADQGKTWSELDVFPRAYLKDLIVNELASVNADSVFMGWSYSRDIIAWGNGNWSVYSTVIEQDASKARADRQVFIVEMYKQNGEYGARLVAKDLPQTFVPFSENDGTQAGNAKDYELQASPTVDYSAVVVKWVELTGVVWPTDSTFQFSGSDIFVNFRKANQSKWNRKANLTNDDILDKTVWIPQLIKNLNKVPVMRLETTGDPGVVNQRKYVTRQLCRLATYDAEVVSDVETEENIKIENFSLIYPNPSTNSANIELNLKNIAEVNLELSDLQGNVLIAKNLNNVNLGLNNINLDLTTLNSGKYFVTVNVNGKRETKSLTVVK